MSKLFKGNLCGMSHGKRSIHWLSYAVVLLVPVEKKISTLCAGKLLKMADKLQGFPSNVLLYTQWYCIA